MDMSLSIIQIIGIFVFIIGAFFILVTAFEKGIGWGFVMLLFGGIAWPLFILLHWKETSYWFYWTLTGTLLLYIF